MKKIAFFFFAMFLFANLFADEVPISKAREIAKNLIYEKTNLKLSEVSIEDEIIKEKNGNIIYYIFNIDNNHGFVIVSAEDHGIPILGYSTTGNFDITDVPVQLTGLLENYTLQIEKIRDENFSSNLTIDRQWEKYAVSNISLKKSYSQLKAVLPLLRTTWNQNAGYNADCPADAGGPGGHAYAGCVATAAGQVMKYYHHPYQGTSSHSYSEPGGGNCAASYGVLSADYSTTTYGFANMPDNSYNAEVATLLYHIGVAVETDYCYDGSGASTSSLEYALETYFGYNSSANYVSKGATSDADWLTLVKGEIDSEKPLIYRGDGVGGGHSFVCDGYDGSDNLHFNFGLSVSYNGYYAVSSINPGTYDFTNNQGAIFGIAPLTTSVPVSDFTTEGMLKSVAAGGSIQFYDQSSGGPITWSWEFPGGTPSTSSSEDPLITYNYPGIYKVSLTATNATGAGNKETKISYIIVGETVTAASCSPTTEEGIVGNYGTGVFRFTLEDIDNFSGSAKSDHLTFGGSGYMDFSSRATTTLEVSTLYNVSVTVGASNNEYVRIYIDYNNNGDFTDAGELVYNWGTATKGEQTGSFTTPANPTLNTLLRCRVISDTWPIQGPCGRTTSPAGQYKYGQAEDYGIYIKGPATTTWDGSESSDWDNDDNWDNGTPGLYTNVIVASSGSAPVINSTASCFDFTINAGASLTINATKFLGVNGDYTIKSPLNNNPTGSFIDNGTLTVNGSTTVERYLADSRWWYLGSPMSDATANAFGTLSATPGTGVRLFSWDETTATYTAITNGATALNPLQGYPYKNSNIGVPEIAVFTGTLNSGAISDNTLTRTATGTYDGYNLVSNPYPSTMDWDAASGWTKTNLDDAIYFRTNGNFGSYISGVGTNGGTQYIPPMQAFWVRVSSGNTSGTIACNNDVRVHNNHNFYKTTSLDNTLHLTITNSANGLTDDTYIRFLTDATDDFDSQYDAYKMFAADSTYPQVYTNNGTDDISINSLSELTSERTVPLGFKTSVSGQFTIAADMVSSFTDNGNTVYLEDLQSGNLQDLSVNRSYQFASGVTTGIARFVLHFNPTITNITENAKTGIEIFSSNNEVNISSMKMLNGDVSVYDMLGQVIASRHLSGSTSCIINMESKCAVYIVKYTTSDQTISRKIFINQ